MLYKPFTPEEYSKVKTNLIDSKAAGSDGIVPEILKYGNFDDIMLEFSNKILTRHEITSQWLKFNIVTYPKSDVQSMTTKFIQNRINQYINIILRPN